MQSKIGEMIRLKNDLGGAEFDGLTGLSCLPVFHVSQGRHRTRISDGRRYQVSNRSGAAIGTMLDLGPDDVGRAQFTLYIERGPGDLIQVEAVELQPDLFGLYCVDAAAMAEVS